MSSDNPRVSPALSRGAIGTAERPASRTREITSAELLGSHREIRIRHANEVYRLRVTSKGKLILTK
jgi:hemin uptake protein HemP